MLDGWEGFFRVVVGFGFVWPGEWIITCLGLGSLNELIEDCKPEVTD